MSKKRIMNRVIVLFLFVLLCILSLFIGVHSLTLKQLIQISPVEWLVLSTTRLPRTISIILDVIFVLDRSSAISEGENDEQAINHFEENPLLEATTAFEKEAIYYLTPDAWYLSNGGAQAYQIMMDDVWKVFQE